MDGGELGAVKDVSPFPVFVQIDAERSTCGMAVIRRAYACV